MEQFAVHRYAKSIGDHENINLWRNRRSRWIMQRTHFWNMVSSSNWCPRKAQIRNVLIYSCLLHCFLLFCLFVSSFVRLFFFSNVTNKYLNLPNLLMIWWTWLINEMNLFDLSDCKCLSVFQSFRNIPTCFQSLIGSFKEFLRANFWKM